MALFDPQTTALVTIDLQGLVLGRALAPHGAGQVVTNSAALARSLKQAGGITVFVHIDFAPDYADAVSVPVDEVVAFPPGGLPAAATARPAELAALTPDISVTKHHWSAFYGTDLDLQLRRRGIKTIILTGVASNFGVESTARDAYAHNYAVIAAEDAISSFDETMHRFSMEKVMPRIARVRKTAEILANS